MFRPFWGGWSAMIMILLLSRNLVLHQHNLWMGHSSEGTSTGLHHDFHDNLYVVIRGQKTFRLYSPRCAELLKTVGKIARIHDNGLIAYDMMRRSDGNLGLGWS